MSVNHRMPLTRYQRDIWVSSAEHPEHPQFNEIFYYRMEGDLDLERLRACIIRVLKRNDPWRLRFGEEDGKPCQWLDPADPHVAVIDFRELPDPRASIAEWVESSMACAFELTGNSLFQVGLVRESERVTYLFGKAHHIVSDGWTLQLCGPRCSRSTGRPSPPGFRRPHAGT